MGNNKYRNGFDFTVHHQVFNDPLIWESPLTIFVNSMSDTFHESCPDRYINEIFNIMSKADRHIFQILTKRSERMLSFANRLPFPRNVWMGVTVESCEYIGRIDHLRKMPAALKFLSMEPLLGPIFNLDLEGIDWVIVGGESGPKARPMDEEWVLEIKDTCNKANVPFFFKQWGGTNKKKAGRLLVNRTWDEKPSCCQQCLDENVRT
jgi:protein gp37